MAYIPFETFIGIAEQNYLVFTVGISILGIAIFTKYFSQGFTTYAAIFSVIMVGLSATAFILLGVTPTMMGTFVQVMIALIASALLLMFLARGNEK